MMIKTDHEHIKTLLVDLAFELQSQNLWQISQPSAAELSSNTPFCFDTLTFEQWLQFIFIPKITVMINQQQALPTTISLTPMAEEAFKHLSMSAKPLIDVIKTIDKTLSAQSE
jgi:uncharacterized protein YqcC (DUF446 family)